MDYLAEVVMWLLAGALGGIGLGEGIARFRRVRREAARDRR